MNIYSRQKRNPIFYPHTPVPTPIFFQKVGKIYEWPFFRFFKNPEHFHCLVASRGHKRWFLQQKVVEGSKNGGWLQNGLFMFLRPIFCICCRGMLRKCIEGGNLECFVGKGWKNLRRENTIKMRAYIFSRFRVFARVRMHISLSGFAKTYWA